MGHTHHFYRKWRGDTWLGGVIFSLADGLCRKRTTESVTMATLKLPGRRLILAGGFAVAIAAAPAVAVVAVSTNSAPTIAACPGGESEDTFTGVCVPDLVPNSPEAGETSSGGLPEVDNIPCTGANTGECIGLSEEQQAQGPMPVPHSTVSSSP
jgi:hypothetical protein